MIFTEEDRLRELRLAQKDIYNAGNDLVSDRKLIADINKRRK